VVILNPSRTHTTSGKQHTIFRTTSETAPLQVTQNYSNQERKEYNTPGYNQRLKYRESYSTLENDPKLFEIFEN